MRGEPNGRGFRIAAVAVLLLGAAGIFVSRVGSLRDDVVAGAERAGEGRRDPAPEFAGIAGWINSEPLTMRGLRGRVVLVDIWTYSCINCIRTLPSLRDLYDRYRDAGLEIVGVHSPEFDFEKDRANVESAVRRHGVGWPVALDSDLRTWDAFENRYWPHKFLIDREGFIRFDHIGEGGEDLVERKIRELLAEGAAAPLPPPLALGDRVPGRGNTPEVYLGWRRGEHQGFLRNEGGFVRDEPFDYGVVDPDEVQAAAPDGSFFLQGEWRATEEYVESLEPGARLILPFRATAVHMVAGPRGELGSFRLEIDGRRLGQDSGAAEDVLGDVVAVDRHDLYDLVRLGGPEQHVLTLRAVLPGVRVYTFTFG